MNYYNIFSDPLNVQSTTDSGKLLSLSHTNQEHETQFNHKNSLETQKAVRIRRHCAATTQDSTCFVYCIFQSFHPTRMPLSIMPRALLEVMKRNTPPLVHNDTTICIYKSLIIRLFVFCAWV